MRVELTKSGKSWKVTVTKDGKSSSRTYTSRQTAEKAMRDAKGV